ncbi:sigma-54-dependent Fis family transcriptional regulator [Sciscionella marina]|uniref:sigma-54-dependent Fis family transcriptional regulator n=1 Tax=Sciscionella marina TaxID=508770 RepID=UPI000370FD7A|nr:helix-turn-helix domain-containing protein [Sciscionella marina]
MGPQSEIALAWYRSKQYGVDPERALNNIAIAEVDRSSRLLHAAAPVLEALTEQLEGTRFGLALTDRDCRIVYRWLADPSMDRAISSIGFVHGAQLDEERIGANAFGTAHELHRAVQIHGGEHYAEPLRAFSCYGHPIKHPLTGRVEGVLDITGAAADSNPLFAPLIARAVADIRTRILEGAQASRRRLFEAFQCATARQHTPVAVLGGDVVLVNRSCLDQLGVAGPALLRVTAGELPRDRSIERLLYLPDGAALTVTLRRIEGTEDGVLYRIGKPRPQPVPHPAAEPEAAETVFITGEPGTGRSHTAEKLAGTALAGDGEPVRLPAADAILGAIPEWHGELRKALREKKTIIVEDVHLFPDRHLSLLQSVVRDRRGRIVCTACRDEDLAGAVAVIAARCSRRITLKPLRERLSELPALAAPMLAERFGTPAPVFTDRAMEILRSRSWQGNLAELRALIERLPAVAPGTGITPEHLPAEYRIGGTRQFGGMDLAERNAIIAALEQADGNKQQAAQLLGIGRTTLYRHMRTLGIPDLS